MSKKSSFVYIWALILIGVEQFIKIIINYNFFHESYPIFEPILYFEPMFNRDYSWFNSLFKLGIGKWVHIFFVGLVLFGLVSFYHYLKSENKNTRMMDWMYIFILAGAVCSFIDKVFWNGSLDYILLEGYFTFDLKDVYINIFNGLLLLALFIKSSGLNDLDDDFLKGYKNYIFRKNKASKY